MPFDITGTLNLRLANGVLSVIVPRVEYDDFNPNFTATSGSAQFTIWATANPYAGGTITGYRVADYRPPQNVLNENFAWTNVQFGDTLNIPGGRYYITVTVSEFRGGTFFVQDYVTFNSVLTVGGGGGGGGGISNRIDGSAFADTLRGGDAGETIVGYGGYDSLLGNGGADRLDGGGGNDTLLGGTGNDRAWGGDGADLISAFFGDDWCYGGGGRDNVGGGDGDDRVFGGAGDDVVFGDVTSFTGRGNDTLHGGVGEDLLFGGAGRDRFVFDTAIRAGEVDSAADFRPADDTIALDDAVFTGLARGVLTQDRFAHNLAGQARDRADRIIYEIDTGRLRYDPDGSGAAERRLFAELPARLAITPADFLVI